MEGSGERPPGILGARRASTPDAHGDAGEPPASGLRRDRGEYSVKWSSEGRGGGYSRARGVIESLLDAAYVGGWPARVWGATRRSRYVREVHAEVVGPRGLRPLRVSFASDLHLGPTTSPYTLDRAFALLAAARPDVLLLGGDFVFLHASREKARALGRRVAGVGARTTLAVLGNHDLWTTHAHLEAALTDAGARVLVNECHRLGAPHDGVAVVGLDDPWTGRPDATTAFAGVGDARVVLVLCHAAEGLLACAAGGHRFDLFVCGHTHGGHVATPLGAPVVPGRVGRVLVSGEHSTPAGRVLISRGVGATELPFRAWAPPDVLHVAVVPEGGEATTGA